MKKLRLAYFGTPDFAADILTKIVSDPEIPVEVALVLTQPDKPVGRKQIITPSPVKVAAERYGLPVFNDSVNKLTESIKNKQFDLALLYAYGEVIPSTLISRFPLGFWNIHPSLLPLYRNVAPMAYPLMLGDEETGISIIQLDDKLDHGPVITQEKTPIFNDEKRSDLEKRLSAVAFKNFKELVGLSQMGNLPLLIEQDHEKATYTRMLKKDDGFIPLETLKNYMTGQTVSEQEFPQILREYWSKYPLSKNQNLSPIQFLYNFYRGMYPWPGVWTKIIINDKMKRLKINEMQLLNRSEIVFTKVQLEGKNEVEFKSFQDAYKIF